jgi:hypothetical protein
MTKDDEQLFETEPLKLSRITRHYFAEVGCATAEVEVVEWQEVHPGVYEPFVLIKLTYLEERTEMSCVWGWWTDHFWSVITSSLPDFLRRFCPDPTAVWEALEQAVRRGDEDIKRKPQTVNCHRPQA